MKKFILLFPYIFFNFLFASSSTYSKESPVTFFNENVNEEKEILSNANFQEVLNQDSPNPPTPHASQPTPPPLIPGFFAVQIHNNTGISDDRLYYLVKGTHNTKVQCFLNFDSSGKGSYVDVTKTSRPFSVNYSFKFSELPGQNNYRYIYLPQPLISGRMYFSIDYPLYFGETPNDTTISDPTAFNLNDPNYYTFFDKIEFTYNETSKSETDADFYVNPTAVDFFCLPIRIKLINPLSTLDEAGFTLNRSQIFHGVKEIINTYDKTSHKVWNKLLLNYVANPFNDQTILANLRLNAPGKSIPDSSNPGHGFPTDYLTNALTYGFNYIDNFWNFYDETIGGNTLNIDVSELGYSSPHFIGTVKLDGGVKKFVFENGIPKDKWTMNKPTGIYSTIPFFAGAGFQDAGEENKTPGAIIIRQLTSAFDVGIFPENINPENFMNQNYFESHKNDYYKPNNEWGTPGANNGPFYDLYSKALHSFNEPIYTFAYDDELAQDGTLKTNAEKRNSYLFITLNPIDSTIPNPYDDKTNDYSVTFSYNPKRVVSYRNSLTGNFTTLTSNPQTIAHLTSNTSKPLQIKVAPGNEIYTIYLKYKIVIPPTADFTTSLGIVITQTGLKTFNVATPG